MYGNINSEQCMRILLAVLQFSLTPTCEGSPTSSSSMFSSVTRTDEICGLYNGRKLYLELGERGVLRASNVSVHAPSLAGGANTTPSHAKCSLEIVTCPSCVITIKFRHLRLSSCSQDFSCRCDYVWITEPPYDASGTPFCGFSGDSSSQIRRYRSQTRIVNIALLFNSNHKDTFTLDYQSERNRQVLSSENSARKILNEYNSSNSQARVLSSPFFPSSYPREFGIEYVISATDPHSRIQLLFSDFQLATASIMEFYEGNGQRIDVTSGASFRPAAIVSTGPSLLVRFYANGKTGLGYRATYTFIPDSKTNSILRPITDCGGFVENPGGAITMMHMVEDGVKYYDCIWIIKPLRNYFHVKTHLSLKTAQFSEFGRNTELEVKQGTTSQGVTLETLRSPVTEIIGSSRSRKELVIPVDVGFYISLRGEFTVHSKLALTYAAFSYKDCFAGADFLCKNHRCISIRLFCDNFDHCGDGSDEPAATCYQDWGDTTSMVRNWYSNTPNYFFPKMERYPDLKTATLVFLVSSLGLILLIVALIVLLYRMGARARQQRELQSRLQTISELLDNARIEDITLDEPPTYEAPPDYDDVIKVGSSLPPAGTSGVLIGNNAGPSVRSALPGRRKKSKGSKRRRAKSSPGGYINPSSSREIPSLCVQHPSSPLVSHRPSWSEPQPSGSEPLLLLPRSRSETSVPDSPPPPYVTDTTITEDEHQDAVPIMESLCIVTLNADEQQGQSLERLLETFEDSFSGVLQQSYETGTCTTIHQGVSLSNIETVVSNELVHSPVPATSSTNNIAEHFNEKTPFLKTKLCKLASTDDICISYQSICAEENAIGCSNVSATMENFANFDEVDQYPSCASSSPLNKTASLSLCRCDSTPNCLFQQEEFTNLKPTNIECLSNFSQLDSGVRVDMRSRSFEIFQAHATQVNRQTTDPSHCTEYTKLLHQDNNTTLNFDMQIQLLRDQILQLEQNTKFLQLQQFERTLNIDQSNALTDSQSSSPDVEESISDYLIFEGLTCTSESNSSSLSYSVDTIASNDESKNV